MFINSLTNVLTTRIQARFRLNNNEFLLISTMISELLTYVSDIDKSYIINVVKNVNSECGSIICVSNILNLLSYTDCLKIIIIAVLCLCIFILVKHNSKKYVCVEFDNELDVEKIAYALFDNKLKSDAKSCGYRSIIVKENNYTLRRIVYLDEVSVFDKKNEIFGKITFIKYNKTINPTKKDEITYISESYKVIFKVDMCKSKTTDLINVIIDIKNDEFGERTVLVCNYYKIFKSDIIGSKLAMREKVDDEKFKNKLISEYFNKHADILKYLSTNGNYHIKNFLLHGPPGTGKSSLITKFAKISNMTLVSINLLDFINCKSNLYKLFSMMLCFKPSDPKERLTASYSDIQSGHMFLAGLVIVLEEIDYAIEKMKIEEDKLFSDTVDIIDGKVFTKSKDINDIGDRLLISDLLELFQGLVEFENRYIFATTNNFDKIKDIIPALFRSGRMTPLYIGYMSWSDLENCVKYYYNLSIDEWEIKKSMMPKEKIIQVSTSSIIELVKKHSLEKIEFGVCMEALSKLIS